MTSIDTPDDARDAAPQDAPAETTSSDAAHAPLRDALRILVKLGALLVLGFAGATAITLFVPEGNDYALAARIQMRQLTAPVPKKIVMIGGSNLNFGVDSAYLEEETGCHVANMGINGYLGVRFMANQAEANVNPGDIVIMAFEHDAFFKSVDGTASDQLVVVKAVPDLLAYYTWPQKLRIAKAIPYIAQQKVLRLLGDSYDYLVHGPESLEPNLIEQVERLSGVTRHGDLVSHLGLEWNEGLSGGITPPPVDDESIEFMRAFAERMEERGVHVLMSYTPLISSYYDEHKELIDELHEHVLQAPPLDPPSSPRDYVYGPEYFFDTVYHLNGEGREMRTRQLLADLRRQLGEDAECR